MQMRPHYENHMKINEQVEDRNVFQKVEENTFQMIPELPKSFEIKTENVNNGMEDYLALDNYINIMASCETASNEGDKSEYLNNGMEDYLALDNYINIMTSCETASNEGHKSPRDDTFDLEEHKSVKSKTEMKAALSAKSISINILPSNNIYDGHRAKNNQHNRKFTVHKTPLSHSCELKDKDKEQNTFPMWRLKRMAEPDIYNNEEENGIDVSICEQAELTEISKGRLTKSNSLPHIYDSMVETGINIDISICDEPELPEISKGQLLKSNSSPHIYDSMVETGINIDISICDEPELPETANVEVIQSKLNHKLKMIGAFLTAIVVMMAVAGLAFMMNYFTLTENTRKNITATDDLSMTSNSEVCFNLTANCNTSLMENNITANKMAREDLIRAVEIGNITQVCNLLKCGAAVNSHRFHSQTPLLVAARNGHAIITQLLLTYKASVDKADSDGHTPLYVAAQQGHVNVVQILLANNALLDESGTYGWTPLHAAAHRNRGVIVELLCTAGANINAQTFRFLDFRRGLIPTGTTALHIATIIGHVNVVQFLLENNALVDTSDSYGWTPLYSAVYSDRYVIVELLCKAGVDVNAKTMKYYDEMAHAGSTALHISVFKKIKRIVKTLLTYNASVNTATKYGCTPLHEAVDADNYAIVELLCKAGADVNAQTERFRINDAANGSTPLHIAVFKENLKIFQLLLTYNASVNKSDINGWTPLHTAVYRDEEASVELLCNAGVDVNAQTHQLYEGEIFSPYRLIVIDDGSTAIHIAVKIRNKRIVRRLIFHKMELLKDNNGLTALDISRKQNSTAITRELETYVTLLNDNSKFSQ